ncbi:hypothetical protein [Peribacillus huizhouensis]|uniref:Uncharacterized protein n=1 Tax=Peribacillus huizhouensis TaxID=1501239 RepID=A0ABR6CWP9_9BACI|nr:hypothetical protein [Peribacillus huizhouensis]MBA9029440.1 hypothetical protein [Peribacillus huizhouensis]
MKLKKLTIKQRLLVVLPLTFVVIAFLMVSNYYFNYQEIKALSDGCYGKGGYPLVERDLGVFNYSFSCKFEIID